MKGLSISLFFLFTLLSQSSFAAPAVSHSHNGRQHSHPLPQIGVTHRHGNGAQGQYTGGRVNRTPGTVIYGTPQPKPPKPYYPPRQTNNPYNDSYESDGTLVFGNTVPDDATVRHQDTRGNKRRDKRTWRDRRRSDQYSNRAPRINYAKGDTSCRNGQSDCNVCASNVKQQFERAASQQIRWGRDQWNFAWPQRYPPRNLRPTDIMNGVPGHALGIPDTHVQGFVRTNSSRYPYAGSHSHKSRGGIFVIKQESNGQKSLASLHQTNGRHPSGVHILGRYLVYGLGKRLYFKDIESPNQRSEISLPIPHPNFGGGLGIQRLSPNNFLVITTGPGGQRERVRYNHFYHMTVVNGRPSSLKFLNKSTSKKPAKWPRNLAYSENLSMITECGTGDIYTVHTTGDEKGFSMISGKGYWRLSKLVKKGNALGLTAVNAFTNRQNIKSCNVRAAASVYVNPQRRLEFYCHGYAKDPDGSTFNVLGRSSRNQDRFRFKRGTL